MTTQPTPVLAQDGHQGTLHWCEPDDKDHVVVKFEGRAFTVSSDLLRSDSNGDYVLELAAKDLLAGHYDDSAQSSPKNSLEHDALQSSSSESYVLPQVVEQLAASKTSITEHVTVRKTVDEKEETVEVPLADSELDVELVEINKPVEHAPQVRTKGDTTIIPVLVERLVTQKQLVLKAEMHVTKRHKTKTHRETHVLREENVSIERNTQAHDTHIDRNVRTDQTTDAHATNEEVIADDAVPTQS